MNTPTTTFVAIILVTGNKAVYEVSPQHMTEKLGMRRRTYIRQYAPQVAHELNGVWYAPGGWTKIDDPKTVALLERCPLVTD